MSSEKKKIRQGIKQWSVFRKIVILTIISGVILSATLIPVFFYLHMNPNSSYKNNSWTRLVTDADRLPNGDTIILTTPIADANNRFNEAEYGDLLSDMGEMLIFDSDKNLKERYTGLRFPHEVEYIDYESENYYIIASSNDDSVKQFNSSFELMWQFRPDMINWTELNPLWDSNHYYNNPIEKAWTHLNDVDFIRGSDYNQTYDSLLISVNRFHLVLLLNFTAEYEEYLGGDAFGSVENIYWWYGPGELQQQHNPDMLPNGNVVICDSFNDRVIEVNTTTKSIVYELTEVDGEKLFVPKDADYNPVDDTYLITDMGNVRIIKVKRSGELLWSYSKHIAFPYEADLLTNGNVLLSGTTSGNIIEVDPTDNSIVWMFHGNTNRNLPLRLVRVVTMFPLFASSLLLAENISQTVRLKKKNEIIKKQSWVLMAFFILIFVVALVLSIISEEFLYKAINFASQRISTFFGV